MSVLSQTTSGATKLLAIDTAGAACSVALRIGDDVVASQSREMVRGQAEALMPMVAEVMGTAEVEFSTLNLIAVTIGPGSFTGLRTGLAAARGLALALAVPIIGVTTTEAIALEAHRAINPAADRQITVVLNSRRGDLYVQHFTAGLVPLGEPSAASPQDIARAVSADDVIFAGDATGQISDVVRAWADRPDFSYFPVTSPNATFVADVAANRWNSTSVKEALVPPGLLYVRSPDAVQPAGQGRLRH